MSFTPAELRLLRVSDSIIDEELPEPVETGRAAYFRAWRMRRSKQELEASKSKDRARKRKWRAERARRLRAAVSP